MKTFTAVLVTGPQSFYPGRWATKEAADVARDRARLHFGLAALRRPRLAKRLGPASPEELRRLARQSSTTRTSKYFGVSYFQAHARFFAYVDHGGERLAIGAFRNQSEAAVAVDRLLRHLGLTSRLNFPELALAPASLERLKSERLHERKRKTTSKYIGVVYVADSVARPWYFFLKGSSLHTGVGGFGNEREAALAHDRAALHYCDRPLLNFPKEARALGPVDFETLRKEIRAVRKRTTSSQYRGVCWNKLRNTWNARIVYQGVGYHLGVFRDEADAGRAYDAAASRFLGAAAILNFPDG